MARIRLYNDQQTTAGVSPRIAPTETGTAITALGDVVSNVATKLIEVRDQQIRDDIYARASAMQVDWTKRTIDAYAQAPSGAVGVHEQVMKSVRDDAAKLQAMYGDAYKGVVQRTVSDAENRVAMQSITETVKARGAKAKIDFEESLSNNMATVSMAPAELDSVYASTEAHIAGMTYVNEDVRRELMLEAKHKLGMAAFASSLSVSPEAATAFLRNKGDFLSPDVIVKAPSMVQTAQQAVEARALAAARREEQARVQRVTEKKLDFSARAMEGENVLPSLYSDPDFTIDEANRFARAVNDKMFAFGKAGYDPKGVGDAGQFASLLAAIDSGEINDQADMVSRLGSEFQLVGTAGVKAAEAALRQQVRQEKTALSQARSAANMTMKSILAGGSFSIFGGTPPEYGQARGMLSMREEELSKAGKTEGEIAKMLYDPQQGEYLQVVRNVRGTVAPTPANNERAALEAAGFK